ncbi:MAG: NEW3 domain-containing protein, partial [Candidatus Nanohaloarchaea archaeon]
TVPGDNPQPGRTPEPRPRLQIDVEPFKNVYSASPGQYAPVALQVQNLGDTAIQDFQVTPSIGEIRQGWQVRPASVSSIPAGGNITREVFVRPPADVATGKYVSPVVAGNGTARYDLDYFTVKVTEPPERSARVSIQESPSSASLPTNSTRRIPVLVENTGKVPLTDVTARLQNAENCAVTRSSTVDRVDVNETASLSVEVETASESTSCDAQLIVSSSEGAYAFGDVQFSTRPEGGFIPVRQRVPFLAIAWTLVLAAYAVLKKRYQLESGIVKAPFVLLLTGESVIILYLIVNYYGFVSVAFLPF